MLSSKNLMKNKKKKGFSLLEIVVSLGLIALFIIPMGNMVLGTVKINKAAEDKQQASAVLQETVEYIKLEEREFPEVKNSYIDINSQFRITRTSDNDQMGVFKVESLNESDYGFKVIGTITEAERRVAESNVNVNENVDGAIYFGGNEQGQITIVNREMSTSECINDIANEGTILFDKVNGNKVNIDSNNGSIMKLSVENLKNQDLHKYNNNSLLVVLDNESSTAKLSLDIINKHHGKQLIIYLYNKNKPAEESDIVKNINTSGGAKEGVKIVPVHSGIEGNTDTVISLYAVKLKAIKGNKQLENIQLDFIK